MTDWSAHYAHRAARMTGSDVSELLALLAPCPT